MITRIVEPLPRLAVGLLFTMVSAGQAADDSVKLTVAKGDPPKEIHESIRMVLQKNLIRLSDKDGPILEFWFRETLPLAKAPVPGRFVFESRTVQECTLMGVVKVHRKRRDFMDEEIPTGVYTLRLGFQPKDGHHLGTAPTDFFALLLPAKHDRKLEGVREHDQLVRMSSKISAAGHPSVLNLQPVKNKEGHFPRLAKHNKEHKLLYLQLPGKVQGKEEPLTLLFGLVFEGTGEI